MAKTREELQNKISAIDEDIKALETKKAEITEKIKKLSAQKVSLQRDVKELTFKEAEDVLSAENVDMESLIKAIKSGKLDISALKTPTAEQTAPQDNSYSKN